MELQTNAPFKSCDTQGRHSKKRREQSEGLPHSF